MTVLASQLAAAGIRRLTLNRPEIRNAFNAQLTHAITHEMKATADDPDTRIVVLAGAGSHFCAGGDIDWMKAVLAATPEQKRAHAQAVADMYQAVYALPQPLVVVVQGAAVGGGFGLACCADFVLAERTARFGMTETRLGIAPAAISPYVTAAIGARMAGRLALPGATVDARQACDWKLVTHLAEPGQLDSTLEALEHELLQCAQGAQRLTKALFRDMADNPPIAQRIRTSVDALVQAWSNPDALQGLTAFLGKTPAPWVR